MVIAVDVGGTKTLVTDFSSEGKKGQDYRFETPRDEQEFISQLVSLIQEKYSGISSEDTLSIALPGQIDPPGVLKYAPNLGWRNVKLADQLQEYFPCRILIENDANLAGLAEAHALPSLPRLCLYVTISTGIGTGIIVEGKLLPSLSSSESGHMLLNHKGKLMQWESFASGHAIVETYRQYARDIEDEKIWQEISSYIAQGLLVLIPVLQPDVIVIGGSIGTYFSKYSATLVSSLRTHLEPLSIDVPAISPSHRPEEAVAYGCYFYATHHPSA